MKWYEWVSEHYYALSLVLVAILMMMLILKILEVI